MSEQEKGKLNWLQAHVPEGLLVDAGWLQRHGYASNLRSKYVAHGWLNQMFRGVYRRPATKLAAPTKDEGLRWQHVLVSLQSVLERPSELGFSVKKRARAGRRARLRCGRELRRELGL